MSKVTLQVILEAIQRLTESGQPEVSSTDIISATQGSSATVRRHLDALCASGKLTRSGQARATRYRLADGIAVAKPAATAPLSETKARPQPAWSHAAIDLRKKLDVPLAARDR